MIYKTSKFLILVFFQLLSVFAIGQNNANNFEIKKIGTPFINNFEIKNMGGGMQNWSATQDKRGIMFFGNNNGILEYDGNDWRLHPLNNNSIVRKVFTAKDGTVYFGAYNSFGLLSTDSKGQIKLNYLSNDLLPDEKDFGEIWKIMETSWGIVFQSFSAIFVYNKKLSTLVFNEKINYANQLSDGRILVGHQDNGLMELTKEGLQEIENGILFKNKSIPAIFNLPNGHLLITTSLNGVFEYDGNDFIKWDNEASKISIDFQLYCGLQLNNSLFAIGTIRNGIYIINQNGQIIQHINKNKGLQNNSVLDLFIDKDMNLWACLDNGIDMVEINSPVTKLFPAGEFGAGYVSMIDNNSLYIGTNQGLFETPWIQYQNKINLTPQLIQGTKGQVWSIEKFNDFIICGHHNGAFEIYKNKAYKITDELGCWKFIQTPSNDNHLIGGTYNGLILIKENKDNFPHYQFISKIEGFNVSCREFEIDNKGWVWVSHGHKGIYKIKLSADLKSVELIEFYDSRNGLPSNKFNSVFKLNGSVFVSTVNGIYGYSPRRNIFIKDEKLSEAFGNMKVNKVYETETGNVWYFQDNKLAVLRSNFNGTYNKEVLKYKGLENNYVENYEHLLPLDQNAFIISTREGFIHLDETNAQNISNAFNVAIRNVKTIEEESIFDGNFLSDNKILTLHQPDDQNTTIPFKNHNLYFSASAIVYSQQYRMEYSFKLDGYDDKWSKWSFQKHKEYHGLNGGTYTLHVKARNDLQIESGDAIYTFKVGKPWYWNYTSLFIYLLLFGLTTYFSVNAVNVKFEQQRIVMKEKQKIMLLKKEEEYEHERLLKEQEIATLKNENLNIENDKNKVELENKSKELASILMKISYTNDLINRTRSELVKVSHQILNDDSKKQIHKVIKTLEQELDQKEDWKKFEVHFDQVHENFIHRLRNKYPELTPKDLKMAAYIRMNLSSKEIAELLNLSHRGVETSRYRLRKKVGLNRISNLTDFLMDV